VKTMISKGCYINHLLTKGETMWSKHVYITLCFYPTIDGYSGLEKITISDNSLMEGLFS
jgi:hypothetical protein